ncbi:MAG: hypothetical protein WD894_21215 [Pirellulales bacterium]
MSTAQLVKELERLSNAERLEVIEAATRLVREDLGPGTAGARTEQDQRMREAAARLKDLYEPGGELTEWTTLDSEDFTDEYVPR